MPLGDEIRRLRTEKGLTQKQLAEAVGVGQQFIAKLEGGSAPRLGADTLYRIADVLAVDCNHFKAFLVPPPAEPETPRAKGKRK